MDRLKYWTLLFFIIPSVYADTTCNVALSSDNDPGGEGQNGELRYCLNTMNENLNAHADNYIIGFDAPMLIQLNGNLPVINNSSNPISITIGSPTFPVVIDGNSGAYSGFLIPTGNVTIQNIIFQNMTAKGGDGGDGISGGGGGLGAGGAIYVPQSFLYGSDPAVTLLNVSINYCSAVGGNGGSYASFGLTGNEGAGGGGGFGGNGGSVTVAGVTGGAGGGGFGGDGGDVTLSSLVSNGGGGGGGGGWGSRATIGVLTNLGNGGSDQDPGMDGNGYGLNVTAGAGGGGNPGGNRAGGGGGGAGTPAGGGGGGSNGVDGLQPVGNAPPREAPTQGTVKAQEGKSVGQVLRELSERASKAMGKALRLPQTDAQDTQATSKTRWDDATPSGGYGGDGAGGGGGAVVVTLSSSNNVDGSSGNGGYGGGGGGAAGAGGRDVNYTVQGGSGGVGGGGGGGGVNQSGATPATGGNSLGGGGGGGGGPSDHGSTALGGVDTGYLGGGEGGFGASSVGTGLGGGGGGGGSGLGAAIFVDSGLNFTIQALPGVPTVFNTSNNTTQAGMHGTGGPEGSDGFDGSALGNSIFLRSNSSLTLIAENANDILTLGDGVGFVDDTSFGGGGTAVFVRGEGTVIYNGTTDYQGAITINNTDFSVNGVINEAAIFVCRMDINSKRGILSGTGTLTGNVFVNSGTISPDTGGTLTLGSLYLNSATSSSLGSLVHTDINGSGTSLVAVTGPATLAGVLEINLDSTAVPGQYTLLTSSGITGAFDSVVFTGTTPNYTISYLPVGSPTFVQLNFMGYPPSSVDIPATVNGSPILNPAVVCCGRPIILGDLPVAGAGPTVYSLTARTGSVSCELGKTQSQQYLKMQGNKGSCTIVGKKNGVTSNPLTVIAS